MKKLFHILGSLKLTVPLLAASMSVVFFGTIDQVHWGINVVQKEYFQSLFCAYPLNPDAWRSLPGIGPALAGAGLRIPMPGGYLIGGLLLLNLVCAHFRHFRARWDKSGIAVTHAGVFLLLVSGFTTAAFQEESMTSIGEGSTGSWSESFQETELALTDTTDEKTDKVTVVPDALLRDRTTKGIFAVPGSAMELRIHRFYPNAPIVPPVIAKNFPGLEPVKVDNGVGARTPLVIVPQNENFSPDAGNSPSAVIEVIVAGKSLGTWLVNTALADTTGPQSFESGGRSYQIALRLKRTYFPFALRLDKFTHEKYAGTDIPKNFASDITLLDPKEAGPRSVTISMNNPLRHGGLTFYQAKFGDRNGTTVSLLQTVRNPSYLLPYAAVALVGAGMCLQFGISLIRFLKALKKTHAHEPTGGMRNA